MGTAGHAVSLASSSLVEEEHQTWYFLATTLCLGLFGRALVAALAAPGVPRFGRVALAAVAPLALGRLLRAWNQTGIKWADRPDIGDWLVRYALEAPSIMVAKVWRRSMKASFTQTG